VICDTGRMQASQASTQAVGAPDPSEYAPYYGKYIRLVGGNDVVAALEDQPRETLALLSTLSEAQGDFRYAPDKWSIKEMLGHVIDAERVFSYRALRFARNDRTPLASFEQDDYVRAGGSAERRLADLIEEFVCVRRATVWLFRALSPEAWMRRGVASDNPVSVRALAYIVAGHELHHRTVLKEKYLTAF
jgi:DinB superfamily